MASDYQKSELWRETLAHQDADSFEEPRTRLRGLYERFWDNGIKLAQRISSDLPSLTLHDESHLSALWDRAGQLAGVGYEINPLEAFIFGGAVLLHDTGHALAAYEGGLAAVQATVEYRDTVARLCAPKGTGSSAELSDISSQEIAASALFQTLRRLHAKHAETLASQQFGEIYLIDDFEIRESLAQLIGRVAASHNWDRSLLEERLPPIQGAPGSMPQSWTISPVKLACLLRCADAIQIDQRRVPAFSMALHKPTGVSRLHWIAQNLAQPIIQTDGTGPGAITFTSQSDFTVEKADAWWLARDLIQTGNRELQGCYQLMKDLGIPTFTVDRVSGAESLSRLEKYVRTSGWRPVDAEVKITSVAQIVTLFGGTALYGINLAVPLRELIQNASDAVRARRTLTNDPFFKGRVLVSITRAQGDGFGTLTIMDNGVGMSERVLTGALIEFGKSLWNSEDAQEEFPGLLGSALVQTGRYGIGFFSTLMISSEITVTSRKFNSMDHFRSLTFREGLSLRPLLLNSTGDSLGDFSTRIDLRIAPEVITNMLTCSGRRPDDVCAINLKNLVAHLCPCLDCDVYTKEDCSITELAHSMDWFKQDPEIWLRQILLADSIAIPELDRYLKAAAPYLQVLHGPNGEPVGRAAIGFGHINSGIGSIGGLTEGYATRHLYQFSEAYTGAINKKEDGPRRDSGTFIGMEGILASWASEQAKRIATNEQELFPRYVACWNTAYFGGDPSEIAVILVNRKIETLENVFNILADGIEITAPISSYDWPLVRLSTLMHIVDSSFHQGIETADIAFAGVIVEPWDRGRSESKSYHQVPTEASPAPSSFVACLQRFAAAKGYRLVSQITENAIIGHYKGEPSKRRGLVKDMEMRMNAIKFSISKSD